MATNLEATTTVNEDEYYADAGEVDRPFPDHWPWPKLVERLEEDDAADAALEERMSGAEADIDELQANYKTISSTLSTIESRLSALETASTEL